MRRLRVLAGVLTLVFTLAARADTFQTFNVNVPGTLGGYAISGTLLFDQTTSLFTGSNLLTSFGTITGAPSLFGHNQQSTYVGFGSYGVTTYAVFNLPGLSLAGYNGGSLCDYNAECGAASSYLFDASKNAYEFNAGSTLTPALAPTPEPSSLLLLATGMGGVLTVARRRFANSLDSPASRPAGRTTCN